MDCCCPVAAAVDVVALEVTCGFPGDPIRQNLVFDANDDITEAGSKITLPGHELSTSDPLIYFSQGGNSIFTGGLSSIDVLAAFALKNSDGTVSFRVYRDELNAYIIKKRNSLPRQSLRQAGTLEFDLTDIVDANNENQITIVNHGLLDGEIVY